MIKEMRKSVKEEWIAALRSGDYVQGAGKLNRNGEYCCLGILCNIAAKQGVVEDNIVRQDGDILHRYGSSVSILPREVAAWAGMNVHEFSDWEVVGIQIGTYATTLANLNDSGSRFETIADFIEEWIEGVDD